MHRLALIVACLLAPAAAAAAEPGRYVVEPHTDGFIRVDTATGATSHCAERDGVWHCTPAVEDTGANERRIAALEAEVAALRAELAALAARPAAPPPPPAAAAPVVPADADLERGLAFSETVMRRFFGLVQEMKRAEQQ